MRGMCRHLLTASTIRRSFRPRCLSSLSQSRSRDMDLLIVRHGIAEDKETFGESGQSDDLRALTPKGRKKMARVARGLRAVEPSVALFASSPLVRARQTA